MTSKKVTIVNYGLGNYKSLINALNRLNIEFTLTSDIKIIQTSRIIIIAGVGSFDAGMHGLKDLNLIEILRQKSQEQHTKFLGICLGMQLMMESSEEGNEFGLGIIPGRNVRLPGGKNQHFPVPHTGWNHINQTTNKSIFSTNYSKKNLYFAHSYYAQPSDRLIITYETDYGVKFPAIIECNNKFGFQFHPEKSGAVGLRLLFNFLEEVS